MRSNESKDPTFVINFRANELNLAIHPENILQTTRANNWHQIEQIYDIPLIQRTGARVAQTARKNVELIFTTVKLINQIQFETRIIPSLKQHPFIGTASGISFKNQELLESFRGYCICYIIINERFPTRVYHELYHSLDPFLRISSVGNLEDRIRVTIYYLLDEFWADYLGSSVYFQSPKCDTNKFPALSMVGTSAGWARSYVQNSTSIPLLTANYLRIIFNFLGEWRACNEYSQNNHLKEEFLTNWGILETEAVRESSYSSAQETFLDYCRIHLLTEDPPREEGDSRIGLFCERLLNFCNLLFVNRVE